MPEDIQKLLDELYALDPSLRRHEAALAAIVSELRNLRPSPVIDEHFAQALQRRLAARADLVSVSNINQSFMKKWNFIFGGIALAAVVALAGTYLRLHQNGISPRLAWLPGGQRTASQQQIERVGNQAFGSLKIDPGVPLGPGRGGGDGTTAALGMGLGDGGDAKIMPPLVTYRYVYTGEELSEVPESVEVYRRNKGMPNPAQNGLLSGLNSGLLDFSQFANLSLQSINATEDRDFGHNLYVNFEEGTVSIGENWTKWQTPDRQCVDEACAQRFRLKPEDLPADQEVISLADAFLSQYGVSREPYGQPFLQDFWRKEYERAADKSQFFIPDVATVIYPLRVSGQEIYDESGNRTGLAVNVNLRVRRVSGMYDLSSQRYEVSSYPAETDSVRLKRVAEQGGFRWGYYLEQPGDVQQTVELGTPRQAMVKIWHAGPEGKTDELLVPSLVFPVVKAPADFYRQSVVVPLVKELLDAESQVGGPIRIMPAQ